MKSLVSLTTATLAADVKLIIDTDAGFDVDDIHALAVAHNLEQKGRVDILATVTSTAFDYSIAGVNVINNYYGRSDIPLGAYKGPFGEKETGTILPFGQNTYLKDLVDNFPNGGILTKDDVPDVLDTYVKVLKEAEDASVTIAVIGFPINIRNLLISHKDLFAEKVKAVYYMNGSYNFGCAEMFRVHWLGDITDCYGAAREVQENFPHNVKEYFQINGEDMCTGGPLFWNKCSDDSNPMKMAHKNWVKHRPITCWPARQSWDPVTMYAAIVGTEEAQMWEEPGTNYIDEKGSETWNTTETDSNEVSLWFLDEGKKQEIVDIINEMLCEGNNVSQDREVRDQEFIM